MKKPQKVGIFDNTIPEEIFHAAGFATFRFTQVTGESQDGIKFLPSGSCLFCTSTEKVIGKLPPEVIGVVFASTCTAQEKTYEVFYRKSNLEFIEILDTPKLINERAVTRYADQLRDLAESFEKKTETKITEEKLLESIKLNNIFRKKLRDKKAIRAEVLKDEALSLENLREKTGSIKSPPIDNNGPNLLFIGSRVHENVIKSFIESEGGTAKLFLTDDGIYYNSIEVPEVESDPFMALARGYLTNPVWSRGISFLPDEKKITKLVAEEKIDGIVTLAYPFCTKMGYDIGWIYRNQEKLGVPQLNLQMDNVDKISASQKTRLSAFMEMLSERNTIWQQQ